MSGEAPPTGPRFPGNLNPDQDPRRPQRPRPSQQQPYPPRRPPASNGRPFRSRLPFSQPPHPSPPAPAPAKLPEDHLPNEDSGPRQRAVAPPAVTPVHHSIPVVGDSRSAQAGTRGSLFGKVGAWNSDAKGKGKERQGQPGQGQRQKEEQRRRSGSSGGSGGLASAGASGQPARPSLRSNSQANERKPGHHPIWVTQLSLGIEMDEVQRFFRAYGAIVSMTVKDDPPHPSNSSSSSAVIVYSTIEERNRALKADGLRVKGARITVQPHSPPQEDRLPLHPGSILSTPLASTSQPNPPEPLGERIEPRWQGRFRWTVPIDKLLTQPERGILIERWCDRLKAIGAREIVRTEETTSVVFVYVHPSSQSTPPSPPPPPHPLVVDSIVTGAPTLFYGRVPIPLLHYRQDGNSGDRHYYYKPPLPILPANSIDDLLRQARTQVNLKGLVSSKLVMENGELHLTVVKEEVNKLAPGSDMSLDSENDQGGRPKRGDSDEIHREVPIDVDDGTLVERILVPEDCRGSMTEATKKRIAFQRKEGLRAFREGKVVFSNAFEGDCLVIQYTLDESESQPQQVSTSAAAQSIPPVPPRPSTLTPLPLPSAPPRPPPPAPDVLMEDVKPDVRAPSPAPALDPAEEEIDELATPEPVVPFPRGLRGSVSDSKEMKELAEKFINEYFTRFDSQRGALTEFYTPTSMISLRVVEPVPARFRGVPTAFPPRLTSASNQISITPTPICNAIRKLPTGSHSISKMTYDVCELEFLRSKVARKPFVSLTVYGEFEGFPSHAKFSFTRLFVLAPRVMSIGGAGCPIDYLIQSDQITYRHYDESAPHPVAVLQPKSIPAPAPRPPIRPSSSKPRPQDPPIRPFSPAQSNSAPPPPPAPQERFRPPPPRQPPAPAPPPPPRTSEKRPAPDDVPDDELSDDSIIIISKVQPSSSASTSAAKNSSTNHSTPVPAVPSARALGKRRAVSPRPIPSAPLPPAPRYVPPQSPQNILDRSPSPPSDQDVDDPGVAAASLERRRERQATVARELDPDAIKQLIAQSVAEAMVIERAKWAKDNDRSAELEKQKKKSEAALKEKAVPIQLKAKEKDRLTTVEKSNEGGKAKPKEKQKEKERMKEVPKEKEKTYIPPPPKAPAPLSSGDDWDEDAEPPAAAPKRVPEPRPRTDKIITPGASATVYHGFPGAVNKIRYFFEVDNKILAMSAKGDVVEWDGSNRLSAVRTVYTHSRPDDGVDDYAYSRKHSTLVVGYLGGPPLKGTRGPSQPSSQIALFEKTDGPNSRVNLTPKRLTELPHSSGGVSALAIVSNHSKLRFATAGQDKSMFLWTIRSSKIDTVPIATGHSSAITTMLFNEDRGFLLSGAKDRRILGYNLETRKTVWGGQLDSAVMFIQNVPANPNLLLSRFGSISSQFNIFDLRKSFSEPPVIKFGLTVPPPVASKKDDPTKAAKTLGQYHRGDWCDTLYASPDGECGVKIWDIRQVRSENRKEDVPQQSLGVGPTPVVDVLWRGRNALAIVQQKSFTLQTFL